MGSLERLQPMDSCIIPGLPTWKETMSPGFGIPHPASLRPVEHTVCASWTMAECFWLMAPTPTLLPPIPQRLALGLLQRVTQ